VRAEGAQEWGSLPQSVSRLPEVSHQCRTMLGGGRGSSRRRRITRLASNGNPRLSLPTGEVDALYLLSERAAFRRNLYVAARANEGQQSTRLRHSSRAVLDDWLGASRPVPATRAERPAVGSERRRSPEGATTRKKRRERPFPWRQAHRDLPRSGAQGTVGWKTLTVDIPQVRGLVDASPSSSQFVEQRLCLFEV
jgi:hypothetical protein